jgi:hypothetical protein
MLHTARFIQGPTEEVKSGSANKVHLETKSTYNAIDSIPGSRHGIHALIVPDTIYLKCAPQTDTQVGADRLYMCPLRTLPLLLLLSSLHEFT